MKSGVCISWLARYYREDYVALDPVRMPSVSWDTRTRLEPRSAIPVPDCPAALEDCSVRSKLSPADWLLLFAFAFA